MQLTPNLDIGGAQETVRAIAKYLPRKGVDVVVVSFRDGDLRPEIEELGVPVEILPDRRHSVLSVPLFLAEMYARRRDLIRIVERYGVSAIQTQGLGSLDFLAMTLSSQTRVWWTIQNASFQLRREHLARWPRLLGAKRISHRALYRMGQSMIEGVIAVSNDTATSYRSYVGGRARVVIVPNAVDTESYPASVDAPSLRQEIGLEPTDRVAIVVATFKRQKGHRHLVEALGEIADREPDLRVVLVGDGELRAEIEGMVHSLGLDDHFRFLGSRRDVPELLAISDVFVLPSLWEGLSVALLEAMSSDLPVVATDVSGTRDVIIDGHTGLLVPPADPGALADAISAVLRDPAAAKHRSRAARQLVVARFSASAQADRLVETFELDQTNGSTASRPLGSRDR